MDSKILELHQHKFPPSTFSYENNENDENSENEDETDGDESIQTESKINLKNMKNLKNEKISNNSYDSTDISLQDQLSEEDYGSDPGMDPGSEHHKKFHKFQNSQGGNYSQGLNSQENSQNFLGNNFQDFHGFQGEDVMYSVRVLAGELGGTTRLFLSVGTGNDNDGDIPRALAMKGKCCKWCSVLHIVFSFEIVFSHENFV